jgi:hypothetical protein
MVEKRCYFKKIYDTESKEGLAYLNRFIIDKNKCRSCLGYIGIETCEYHITEQEVNEGGLVRLAKTLKSL